MRHFLVHVKSNALSKKTKKALKETMQTPFSLRIFVADGDPDGLRIVERSNWVGRALVFPRAALVQPSVTDRPELQQTVVYLLLGPRKDGEGDRLYIGEGDPIKPRLATHHSGKDQKDFWTRAICFVSKGQGLNKAHVQFLESNLIRLAKQAKRVPLDVENKKNESEPTLSEADRADMQGQRPTGAGLRIDPGFCGQGGFAGGGASGAFGSVRHVGYAPAIAGSGGAGRVGQHLRIYTGLCLQFTQHSGQRGAGPQCQRTAGVEGRTGALA